MNNIELLVRNKYDKKFFENVTPTRLTEGRRVKLNVESWGLLYDYYLESVKITWVKSGAVHSTATLKVGDRSGRSVCVVRGPSVGMLFGMSPDEWGEVEKLCGSRQQLFYRYFKDGISPNLSFEQRMFYTFCLSNQKTDSCVAVFKRGVNLRNRDKSDAFLEILELKNCDSYILDLYVDYLRTSTENVTLPCVNNNLAKSYS